MKNMVVYSYDLNTLSETIIKRDQKIREKANEILKTYYKKNTTYHIFVDYDKIIDLRIVAHKGMKPGTIKQNLIETLDHLINFNYYSNKKLENIINHHIKIADKWDELAKRIEKYNNKGISMLRYLYFVRKFYPYQYEKILPEVEEYVHALYFLKNEQMLKFMLEPLDKIIKEKKIIDIETLNERVPKLISLSKSIQELSELIWKQLRTFQKVQKMLKRKIRYFDEEIIKTINNYYTKKQKRIKE